MIYLFIDLFLDEFHEGVNPNDILIDGIPLDVFLDNMTDSIHTLFSKNTFMLTRMFDSRAQSFIKHILMGHNKTGMKVKNFCYRIEFQGRGMPHIHGVLWLDRETIKDYLIDPDGYEFDTKEVPKFIDSIISCSTDGEDETVNKIAREVNVHGHTPSCGKYKTKCRYGFPKPPSDETIIAEPLPKNMDEKERESKLKDYRKIMKKVKEALESPNLDEYADLRTFLNDAEIDYDEYKKALRISERGKTVVLKRSVKDRMVNNYNPMFLKAWNGNLDIQFCQDTYAGNSLFHSCFFQT